jgi:hypothetical protein
MKITVTEAQVPVTETVVVYKTEKTFTLELTEREALIISQFAGRTFSKDVTKLINADLRDHRNDKRIDHVALYEVATILGNLYNKLI